MNTYDEAARALNSRIKKASYSWEALPLWSRRQTPPALGAHKVLSAIITAAGTDEPTWVSAVMDPGDGQTDKSSFFEITLWYARDVVHVSKAVDEDDFTVRIQPRSTLNHIDILETPVLTGISTIGLNQRYSARLSYEGFTVGIADEEEGWFESALPALRDDMNAGH